MAMNVIDFYENPDGGFLRREWAMGGESWSQASEVPEEITGYDRKLTPPRPSGPDTPDK